METDVNNDVKCSVKRKPGFTLIEMIGVIAIIAILAAFITPKVFQSIEDSKVTRFVGETPSYAAAVTKWYKDVGTLQSLTAAGAATTPDTSFELELISNQGTTSTTGLWARWDGPYIDSVANISLGSVLTIETNAGASGTAAPAATNSTSWDLDDNDKNEMAGSQVVAMKITGILDGEFSKVDGMLDKGLTAANNATSGRVKYDASGDVLYIYMASL